MSTAETICQIPGNSDIAGVGVRASVYIQACLAGFNLFYMAFMFRVETLASESPLPSIRISRRVKHTPRPQDVEMATQRMKSFNLKPPRPYDELEDYIDMTKGLERVLFMLGFAVISSALIEAKSEVGLSQYHALIILNVSQINHFAGFLTFCMRVFFGPRSGTRKRDYLLGSIPFISHSFMMSGLGIYFWTNLGSFLAYASAEQPCQASTYFWVLGRSNVGNNEALRKTSLVFYSLNAIPFVGHAVIFGAIGLITYKLLILLWMFINIPFMLVQAVWLLFRYPLVNFILKPLSRLLIVEHILGHFPRLISAVWDLRTFCVGMLTRIKAFLLYPFYGVTSLILGVFISVPLIYTIVSTELTIMINSGHVEPEAENKWTYGQTLALTSSLVGVVLYAHGLIKLMQKMRKTSKVKIGAGQSAKPGVVLSRRMTLP
ncbi:hypothetical protein FPV67DRAFT_1724189 [Lyophyllum atratum]|nr:hypothetical protein FPV67DRAFT_1724189 [Lyophyllum atratum]